ncbi:MAG TPA: hypothetical protein VIF62_12310, partial [Labilithrix sp.]
MSPLPEPLRALAEAWLDGVRAPRRRAIVAGFCLVFTIAMFVARIGTIRARVAAFGILAAALGAIVAIRVIDRRVFADPAKTIARVAGHAEPELAARATRALSLRAADGARGTSRELADLHVQRTLAALPIEAVDKSAARLG